MPIRENERSTVIELISEINLYVSGINIRIKKAGGEATLFCGGRAMFPDIILFGDTARTQILQGWEAKMPDVPITDEALIRNAETKAATFGVNSFFLWNFSAARLYVKNARGIFAVEKSWDLSQISTRADVDTYEEDWKNLLHTIIVELSGFFDSGIIRSSAIENVISEQFGATLILRDKLSVAETIRNAGITDTRIEARLQDWWSVAKGEYYKDETTPYSAYAKSILLHWLDRLIFAHLIKRYFNPAAEVENIVNGVTPTQANAIFGRITAACDFYNIFVPKPNDELLSVEAWDDIIAVNMFFKDNDVNALSQESLQNILEKTVNTAKRALNGQFPTPSALADILVRITLRNLRGEFFDPCCGTGTIAKAAKDYKRGSISVADAIKTVWAEDKDSFLTQIAQLSIIDVSCINNPTNVFQKNIFDLYNGETIGIVDPANGATVNLTLPQFDAIASNLPFIAFETISVSEVAKINRVFDEVSNTATELNRRSDIYVSIVFALWKHLKAGAYLGIITSNSWLGNEAGQQFVDAAAHYYHIEQVHTSGKGKWFANADVVTTILLLRKKGEITAPAQDERTSFYLWSKSLEEFASDDAARQTLVFSALQDRCTDANIATVRTYTAEKIKNLEALNISRNALFYDISWALDISGKLCKITNIFEVFRGERRGWDKMFYPKAGHGIENAYIKPVLLSSKNILMLTAQPDGEAFCCGVPEQDLIAGGQTGALRWINRFANENNEKGIPLPEVLGRAKTLWYEMSDAGRADIVTTMNPETRFFYAAFDTPTFINQRLIGLKYKTAVNRELCHALLNTMLSMFLIEFSGFGRGLGVLDINKSSISSSYMLNPALITEAADEIITAFSVLKNRTIKPTEEELRQADRIAFDRAVLRAYGIENLYDSIKNSLLSMQRTRLSVK